MPVWFRLLSVCSPEIVYKYTSGEVDPLVYYFMHGTTVAITGMVYREGTADRNFSGRDTCDRIYHRRVPQHNERTD